MFLAVWIDESQAAPRDRVVVCVPAVRRLNGAVAVLRSDSHDGALATIISGDVAVLKRFAEALRASEDVDLNGEPLLRAVEHLARSVGASIVPLDRPPIPSLAPPPPKPRKAKAVCVVAVMREPAQRLYPRYITRQAKPIWDEVVERNAELLKRYRNDKERMWAAAIFLFQREAASRGVRPFSRDPAKESHQKKIRREIYKRIERGNALALKATDRAFELLKQADMASSMTAEKFYESAHKDTLYYLTTFRVVKLRVEPNAAMERLIESGWGNGQAGRYVYRVVDSYTSVLAEPVGKQLYLYCVTRMTHDLLVVLFGLEEDADPQDVMRELSVAGRRWVRTGTLVTIAMLLGLVDGRGSPCRQSAGV